MTLRKKYLNLSIKYKLLILVYLILLVNATAFGVYSYSVSVRQVRERITTSNKEVVRQISSSITFLQNDTVDLSSFIAINNGIQTVLDSATREELSLPRQQLKNLDALEFILSAIVTKDYLTGMVLYDSKGNPVYNEFTDGSSGLVSLGRSKTPDIRSQMDTLDGKPYWFRIEGSGNPLLQNTPNAKIVMGRVVKNVDNNDKIGYVLLFINQSTIEDIYSNNLRNSDESFFITDLEGRLVSNAGRKPSSEMLREIDLYHQKYPLSNSSLTLKDGNDDVLVSSAAIPSSNWRICYAIPMKNMISQISSIKRFTILMIILAAILTFPFIYMISMYFTAPIKKLLQSMKRFEKGYFDERVDFKYADEIGMLGNGYNRMVGNIKELIDSSYKLQIKEKEAELRALQAQINPHFLYNTLNTIYWKAVKTDQTEISEMTLMLSKLFRLTLNMGRDWVPLSDEKELIYCYLSLQAIRFKSRLRFEIDIEDEIIGYGVPKLLLLPFVENSIVHGIGDRAEGGEITVSAYKQTDRLYFVIRDNGLGMNNEVVDALNHADYEKYRDPQKQHGFGVQNVIERLELTYGNEYSLEFTSTLGEGATVRMSFPIQGSRI